jgi:pimeloyl-ACP methyl ester carboxylesterase
MSLTGRMALWPGVGPILFKKVFSKGDLRRHFRSAYRDPAILTEELLDYFWELFERAGAREANYAILRNALAALVDNSGDPGRVQAETIIVWGEEDRLTPLAHGKRLQKQIAGARLDVIPATGHSPHEERPEELLRSVLPCLAGESAQAADG